MGILSKLLGRNSEDKGTQKISQDAAVEIIQRYGAVLEHDSPAPGCVADESKLPYSKANIKEALIIGLRATADRQMKKFLQAGYVQLADWQEGVGDSSIGIDLTNIDPDVDVIQLAESIASQGDDLEKWMPIVTAEQEDLKKELIELGLWIH